MIGLTPNCMDDFLFSNPTEQQILELILSRKLPFPFAGKSGILFYGTWGTGKSTFATLLPELLETAYSSTWNFAHGVGQMPAAPRDEVDTKMFRCGGGLSSTNISNVINTANSILPIGHYSRHDYFVFDELDKLTSGGQQSLKSLMDLKRSMFFLTTNYLPKIDRGIINRCHLVEMNQPTKTASYLPIGNAVVKNMGLAHGAISSSALQAIAAKAKGSLRDFVSDVAIACLLIGGVMPTTI